MLASSEQCCRLVWLTRCRLVLHHLALRCTSAAGFSSFQIWRVQISRRRFLALGAAGVALVGTDAFAIEPNRVSVSRHVLGSPSSSAPLRIVQLSDLHLQHINAHVERIARRVNEVFADVVLLTGDSIDRQDRLPELSAFLDLLGAQTPKYAILGNWEHWARVDLAKLEAVYARANCQLLVNQTAELQHQGRILLFTGLDDLTGGRPDLVSALRGVEPRTAHLLLAHSPAYRDHLALDVHPPSVAGTHLQGEVDLSRYTFQSMLSGHTHGGQIAPFGWAPLRPPGSGRYVSGWYKDAVPHLYVSRGLGTSVIPARFGAPPEIAVFDWHHAS